MTPAPLSHPTARATPRAFAHIETWVFDLDNTLYPHHLNLWQQVDERIRNYIAKFLDTTHDEAFRKQKDFYRRYGTTMRGMMLEHGMNPDDRLPGRKLILTNGTRAHADAVMKRLAVDRHFEDVFDIIAGELEPKPLPQTYDRFLARHGVDAGRAAMFEDLARNLEVPHALGMTTVLVVPERTREVFREGWELEGRDAAHVDHVTDDLVGFLEAIAGQRAAPPCPPPQAGEGKRSPAPIAGEGAATIDIGPAVRDTAAPHPIRPTPSGRVRPCPGNISRCRPTNSPKSSMRPSKSETI